MSNINSWYSKPICPAVLSSEYVLTSSYILDAVPTTFPKKKSSFWTSNSAIKVHCSYVSTSGYHNTTVPAPKESSSVPTLLSLYYLSIDILT